MGDRRGWQYIPRKKRAIHRPRQILLSPTKISFWEQASSIALTIQRVLFGLIGTLVFASFTALIYQTVTTPTVSILPINSPKNVTENGYTPEVLALQLRVKLLSLVQKAGSSKSSAEILTDAKFSNIDVPKTGMSLDMVTSQIRSLFAISEFWQVSGNLEQTAGAFKLKLVVEHDGRFDVLEPAATNDIDDVIAASAEYILQTVDPYMLASVYLDSDPDRSRELADHIILTFPESDPAIAWAHILKSAIYYNARSPIEALKEADQALLLAPENAVAHLNRGSALLDLRRVEEAIVSLKQSIAINPSDARPHIMLGTALKRPEVGKVDDAISEFRTAVKLSKDNAMAHYALANGLKMRARDREEAIAEFQYSIQLNRNFALAHFGLASILCENKALEEAVQHLRRAVSIEPNNQRYLNALTCAENSQARQRLQPGRITDTEGNCACLR